VHVVIILHVFLSLFILALIRSLINDLEFAYSDLDPKTP